MSNIFKKILKEDYNIEDTVNKSYKSSKGRKISNKLVRGSVRSQLGKFVPSNQFEINKAILDNNPLP